MNVRSLSPRWNELREKLAKIGQTTTWESSGPAGMPQAMWDQVLHQAVSAHNAKQKPNNPPITDLPDMDLIWELISRGYAVAKIPAETLAEEVGK